MNKTRTSSWPVTPCKGALALQSILRSDRSAGVEMRSEICQVAALPISESESGWRSLTNWTSDLIQAWQRDAANTLERAHLLSRARTSLEKHGQWTLLFRSGLLPFKKAMADRLVLIGRVFPPDASNASNWIHLTSSSRTLYHLAQLGRLLAEQLIAQGRIHPRLSLNAAKALLTEYRPDVANKDPRSALEQRLARFGKFVRANVADWSVEERQFVRAELVRLAAQLGPEPLFPVKINP